MYRETEVQGATAGSNLQDKGKGVKFIRGRWVHFF